MCRLVCETGSAMEGYQVAHMGRAQGHQSLFWRTQVYAWLGVEPPRGVLLHGPPGCGKTALAHAIAHETGVPFLRISAPEIVAGVSGARAPQTPQSMATVSSDP